MLTLGDYSSVEEDQRACAAVFVFWLGIRPDGFIVFITLQLAAETHGLRSQTVVQPIERAADPKTPQLRGFLKPLS
jgi:hypothetical protein